MKIVACIVLGLALFTAVLSIYGATWVDPEPRVTQRIYR
jgi:hypothetical protein